MCNVVPETETASVYYQTGVRMRNEIAERSEQTVAILRAIRFDPETG